MDVALALSRPAYALKDLEGMPAPPVIRGGVAGAGNMAPAPSPSTTHLVDGRDRVDFLTRHPDSNLQRARVLDVQRADSALGRRITIYLQKMLRLPLEWSLDSWSNLLWMSPTMHDKMDTQSVFAIVPSEECLDFAIEYTKQRNVEWQAGLDAKGSTAIRDYDVSIPAVAMLLLPERFSPGLGFLRRNPDFPQHEQRLDVVNGELVLEDGSRVPPSTVPGQVVDTATMGRALSPLLVTLLAAEKFHHHTKMYGPPELPPGSKRLFDKTLQLAELLRINLRPSDGSVGALLAATIAADAVPKRERDWSSNSSEGRRKSPRKKMSSERVEGGGDDGGAGHITHSEWPRRRAEASEAGSDLDSETSEEQRQAKRWAIYESVQEEIYHWNMLDPGNPQHTKVYSGLNHGIEQSASERTALWQHATLPKE